MQKDEELYRLMKETPPDKIIRYWAHTDLNDNVINIFLELESLEGGEAANRQVCIPLYYKEAVRFSREILNAVKFSLPPFGNDEKGD